MDKKESMLKYEKAHVSAENYNTLIWTVFSIGIAFSLYILYIVWPFKTSIGAMQFFMSILGFLVLFYCTLTLESFNQKKSLMYKIFDKNIKGFDIEKKIKKLTFFKVEWLAEIILSFLFLAYVYYFWFVWNNNSLAIYGGQIIFLALPMFIISLILSFIVMINWILRPKNGNGNPIEKFRKFLFGNWLKSYGGIVEESLW